MVLPRGTGDFYHKYRPQTFSEIVGHSAVVGSLRKVATMASPAQSYLFSGDSGCGKTTAARILAMALNCSSKAADGSPCTKCDSCRSIMEGRLPDVVEINAADTRGIDDIRALKEQASLSPVFCDNKVFILDEAHSLTKDAQQMLLKLLEEAPKGVFTILCSTDPQKIIPTVRNRCQTYKFPKLSSSEVSQLVKEVWALEGNPAGKLIDDALKLVVEAADGSARAALVSLQQVYQALSGDSSGTITLQDIQEMLSVASEETVAGLELARALSSGAKWSELMQIVKSTTFHPEAIRMSVLGYFRSCLMSRPSPRNYNVMKAFSQPFVGPKPENSLVMAIYEALDSSQRSRL